MSNICNMCKKASRQLGILKRIGKNLYKLGKLNIYNSFILSNFSYCPLSWHFYGETNTKKLEKKSGLYIMITFQIMTHYF